MVATPIGNLADVTLRALHVLRSCTHVYAEDTRVSQRLLSHHGIARALRPLHQHSREQALDRVAALIAAGEPVAYMTDAGTPGVSDPGAALVRRCRQAGIRVVPVPGASAAAAAVSVAGLSAATWLFVGFLPSRPGARRSALDALAALPHALVFYEAPHRIGETLSDLAARLGDREVVICRELTKLHEEVTRLPLAQATGWLAESADRLRGEFVLVVDAADPAPSGAATADAASLRRTVAVLAAELPAAQAARLAAKLTGASRDDAYAAALSIGRASGD